MQRTIYVPDGEKDLLEEARKLLGEPSVSALILRLVREALLRERSRIREYDLPDRNKIVKVVGRELCREGYTLKLNGSGREVWADPRGDRFVWWFTAYQSKRGRIIIHCEKVDKIGASGAGWVEVWDNIAQFTSRPVFHDESGESRQFPTRFSERVRNETGPILEIIE